MLYTFYARKNQRIDFERLLIEQDFSHMGPTWFPCTKNVKEEFALMKGKELIEKLGNFANFMPGEPTDFSYRSFRIPKKSDPHKFRQIDEPNAYLKTYQRCVKEFFEKQLRFLPNDAAHAYVAGRSVVTAMEKHKANESRWFLKLDVKDFFPKHNKEFIMRQLKQVYPFGIILMDEEKAPWIERWIDYALLNDGLPQGTPLSPLLTNITMVPIDYHIQMRLHNCRNHYVYTRYADDIIISCKVKFDKNMVENIVNETFSHFHTPFQLNSAKTRFGSSNGRNWNLGIMLNKDNQMTIGYRNNHKLRAALFKFFKDNLTGERPWSILEIQQLTGNVSWYMSVQPKITDHYIDKYNEKFNSDFWELARDLLK